MAKNLKLTIKNTQIAKAVNLGALKNNLAKKMAGEQPDEIKQAPKRDESKGITKSVAVEEAPKEDFPRIKARTKSVFAEQAAPDQESSSSPIEEAVEPIIVEEAVDVVVQEKIEESTSKTKAKTSLDIRNELFAEELKEVQEVTQRAKPSLEPVDEVKVEMPAAPAPKVTSQEAKKPAPVAPVASRPPYTPGTSRFTSPGSPRPAAPGQAPSQGQKKPFDNKQRPRKEKPMLPSIRTEKTVPREFVTHTPREKLGPTGKHIKDFLPPPPPPRKPQPPAPAPRDQKPASPSTPRTPEEIAAEEVRKKAKQKGRAAGESTDDANKKPKTSKFKEFRDLKPAKKVEGAPQFDPRARHGLVNVEEEQDHWRKRRQHKVKFKQEEITVRPTTLKVRTPISIKDLAAEMKLKASQVISNLFLHGLVVTLNDVLDDETTIQLLGEELGCEITIDKTEKDRIRITDKSIKEEIDQTDENLLKIRPPVVAFMGHVDHGKTSLIDVIRKSNRTAGEAGAITQHIGAFLCKTAVGDIAILDTPGHEAFSAMRARGADVTDIVVLVVAGDEGIRQQTLEAINHARAANVTIIVALNKSDKPNFNPENVYRQMAENDLLPEAWGGQIITVNCSAVTGEGIQPLLEMLAIQAEVLELRANPEMRARGSVLESKMQKGLGAAATVLVQNGTLRLGDAVVFGNLWGRVKTMRDEFGLELKEAPPSTPVEITGLSGLPEAGHEFIVVKNERDAREIGEIRMQDFRHTNMLTQQKKKISIESLVQQAMQVAPKKVLTVVVRADVQGSLEALRVALLKIESQKAELNIIFGGIGEITESDVQLASASKAVIIGFHTQIESHADQLLKEHGVQVRLHDIIYHAVDDAKVLMAALLEKIPIETEKGKAEVLATFKSSQVGVIAGCKVTEGTITRNNQIRLKRAGELVWKGSMSSLKRVKEDVREVQKGIECGILLNGYADAQPGDILEAYDVTYISQEL